MFAFGGIEYTGQVGEIREVRKDNKFPSKDVYKVAIPGESKLIQFKGSQVEVLSEVE